MNYPLSQSIVFQSNDALKVCFIEGACIEAVYGWMFLTLRINGRFRRVDSPLNGRSGRDGGMCIKYRKSRKTAV